MDDTTIAEVDRESAIARLEAIADTQATVGWMWFIGEIHAEMAQVEAELKTVVGEQAMGRLQGRSETLQQMLDFEDLVDLMLSNLQEEEEHHADV